VFGNKGLFTNRTILHYLDVSYFGNVNQPVSKLI
jgi:hypothetical protein